ncbi:hypothetical protein GLAREA_06543 [Glarea lozoyensis ATCC 20868]|uniref:Uncharacterized protein n=1 Tax=Glarea lozoyensis (strain ATCC 20868 / MF5171) TaxID=1116229 RepID=S3D6W2_GLAL2|nr:uncharacterized protein GLAREA_06543 [Glarea lozoyensis ATCC 20868]EPE33530.1 hypothetical protein GLAREA_06543 [Glarea lozoyensis ATCC 20868]
MIVLFKIFFLAIPYFISPSEAKATPPAPFKFIFPTPGEVYTFSDGDQVIVEWKPRLAVTTVHLNCTSSELNEDGISSMSRVEFDGVTSGVDYSPKMIEEEGVCVFCAGPDPSKTCSGAFSVTEAESNTFHNVWTSKGVSLSAPSGDEDHESPAPMKYLPSVTEDDAESTSSSPTPIPQSSSFPNYLPPSDIVEDRPFDGDSATKYLPSFTDSDLESTSSTPVDSISQISSFQTDLPSSDIVEDRPFDEESAPMKYPPSVIESPSNSSASPKLTAPLPDDSSLPSEISPGDVPTSDVTPSDDGVDEMIPTLPYLNSGTLNSSAPTATIAFQPHTSLPPYISGNATNTTNSINAVGTVGVVIGSGSSTITAQLQGWNTTSTATSSVVTTTIPIPSDRIPTASLVAPPASTVSVSAVGSSWSFNVDFALLGLLAVGAVFVTL